MKLFNSCDYCGGRNYKGSIFIEEKICKGISFWIIKIRTATCDNINFSCVESVDLRILPVD